ncbi:unnamed protein product [Symbiodinium sp. CCMP2456]|nr:unnamed protein product [Symbiodinium sp. CCMP2456]
MASEYHDQRILAELDKGFMLWDWKLQGFSLAESEEFVWPMPGKQSSQLLRSETPRAKQRRRKAALAVASDGEFLGMPPQAEELLELGMPDLGSVAGGLGRQAICTFKSLMIAAMKMCAFCYILVTTAVSMYCAVSYSLPLASLIIGVVDGLAAGVANVQCPESFVFPLPHAIPL